MWICPACQLPLSLGEGSYRCANQHSYDLAKDGYVNLLLAQHKRSKEPGDNRAMVNARREFLQQGYYQPLAKHLAELLNHYHDGPQLALFDVGCGEGYYLQEMIDAIHAKRDRHIVSGGLDISKVAVQKAAKKYPQSQFAVASSYNLPLNSNSQDALIQIFAPSGEAEIHRVLAEKGLWLQVNPGAEHLHQLKQCIYDTPGKHTDKALIPGGFTVLDEGELNFDICLDTPQMRMNLLMMTPYYWTATKAKVELILATLGQVKAHFSIRVLQKSSVVKPIVNI